MKEKKIYLQERLTKINKSMIELHIERRKLRKELTKLQELDQKVIRRENKRQQAIAESIYLLKSHPNKRIKSKDILQHLKDTIDYNTDSFASIFRTIQRVEPNINQVKRGYYIYKI
ncbi:hypothetical protein PQ796_02960 (plasmid) [Priestia megaterium]|uniref:Rok-like winged helix domain-containing protein n=1 Tax=Priestia megaterium TaxID=1404 RepID=UPI0024476897|nr:hypothetical protein [Priestia megaterium]MDH2449510.1 hypothetical protein [Priestia megaterium]MDL5148968.1 hypothetical protein [Priestia megaterium]